MTVQHKANQNTSQGVKRRFALQTLMGALGTSVLALSGCGTSYSNPAGAPADGTVRLNDQLSIIQGPASAGVEARKQPIAILVLHHTASSINPYHWLFVVGFLLMAVVLISPAKALVLLRRRLRSVQ